MKDYLKYKAIDFAEDPAFIHWVQAGCDPKIESWAYLRSSSGSLNIEIKEAIDIVKIFQFKEEAIDERQTKELFERIERSIPDTSKVLTKQKKSIVRYLVPAAVAACIAALLLFYNPDNKLNTFETAVADHSEVKLPDESVVSINSESKISYKKSDFAAKRIIHLEGEAFFDVQKGKAFIVKTPHGQIEVLGTSFNIFDRGNSFEVACLTGKVKVSNIDKTSSVILQPLESCRLIDNGKIIKSQSKSKQESWRRGIYHFEKQKISSVFEEVERQFDIKIIANKEILDLEYTGFFESKNLEDALHAICWPLRLETKIEGRTVKVIK